MDDGAMGQYLPERLSQPLARRAKKCDFRRASRARGDVFLGIMDA